MYEKVTDRARKVMELANEEALSLGPNAYIDTHHLLLGLVKEGAGVAAHALKGMGLNETTICDEARQLGQLGTHRELKGKLPLTPHLKAVVERSFEEAAQLDHHYVGTEHLLLALVHYDEGVAARILSTLAIDRSDIRREVLEILGYQTGG